MAGKANTAKTFGQYMNKEGLNEFYTTHMHGFGLSIVGIILVVERHTGIIHGIYAAVADSTVEYITGKNVPAGYIASG